ncbi:MAG: serine/threonine protein kinase [Gemmatimonadaceae bacterium]|nr:serine/threonine protein kinase [Gemmatimonadaceae bacterium]
MPDPVDATADTELLARVERALAPQYEVEGELGRGGMGIVYRARDTRLKRTVAVKLLPPELAYRTEIKSRFLREAEMAAQLAHPNIVPIYSVDEKDGLVYFIMACVDGDNLGKQMATRGPLPVADVRRIMREVAGALAFAHARKFVHRDIKPDNILIDKDDGRAIVTDFGIARAVQDGAETRLTATGIAIGTPAYMSPEQCAGEREIDGRADLYALGTLGYQMLAGRLPFEANSTPALLVKQLSEKPLPIVERRPDTPPDLAGIIMRLLEKEPSARYATADELTAALDGRISSGYRAPAPVRPAAPLVGQAPQPAWVYGGAGQATGAMAAAPAYGAQPSYVEATADEVARWYAPQVVKFRKGLAPFLTATGVTLLMKMLNVGDLTFIPAFWSIGIAMGYAKLWQAGYDWRDVFKQQRHVLLADVMSEKAEDVAALWDPNKRNMVRERQRLRLQQGTGGSLFSATDRLASEDGTLPAGVVPGAAVDDRNRYGTWLDAVRDGVSDRAEIQRMYETLPKAERGIASGILSKSEELLNAVKAEAAQLADLDRNAAALPDVGRIESEIAMLEAQANPLERGSEERVRRLARLRREGRLASTEKARRERSTDRLERARAALRSIRFDLVKLRTGATPGSAAQVTQLAERAQELARDVDAVLAAVGSEKASRTSPGTR